MCCISQDPKENTDLKIAASYLCRVEIKNSMPGTIITKTLAYFYYDGSSTYGSTDPRDGPGDVNIPHGEATHRYSRNDTDCVTKVEVFVLTDNAGPLWGEQNADSGHCLTGCGFEIAPRATILKEDPAKATLRPILLGTMPMKEEMTMNTSRLTNGHGIIIEVPPDGRYVIIRERVPKI